MKRNNVLSWLEWTKLSDFHWLFEFFGGKLLKYLAEAPADGADQDPIENWNGKQVYGVYLEQPFSPSGRALRYVTVIIIRPRRYKKFLWFKWGRGLEIEGICFSKYRGLQELRRFCSLHVNCPSREPLCVEYSFCAEETGSPFYDEGFIRFAGMTGGTYQEAEGTFALPAGKSRCCRRHDVRIAFRWQRLPASRIKTFIGKSTIENRADIRLFKRRGGLDEAR